MLSATPPATAPHAVPTLRAQFDAIARRATALGDALAADRFFDRPAPARWSVGEHLAHLALFDAALLPDLDAMLDAAPAVRLDGPGRHPWLGRLLVRAAEPPVLARLRARPAFVPHSVVRDRGRVLADFAASRDALAARLARAEGRDLGVPRRPFAPANGLMGRVSLSLGQWFAMAAAHGRRHLWLAQRAVDALPGEA